MKKGQSKYSFGSYSENKNNYMNSYMKQKIICECGQKITKSGIPSHKKSNKHKLFLLEKKYEELIQEKEKEKENISNQK